MWSCTRGSCSQAAELLQQGAQLGSGPDGQPLPIAGLASHGAGRVLRERNELDAAMHSLRTGIALARQWGIHVLLVDSTIALARLHQACGDGDGALQVLRDFEVQTHEAWDTPWHRAQLAACRARLWLAQGQRALASQWAQDYAARLEADAPNLRPLVKYAFAHTTLARVRLAEGQPEEAIQLLTRLLAVAEAGGWMGDVIEILALQALALQVQGATTQAFTHPRARAGAGRAGGICAHLRGRRRADGRLASASSWSAAQRATPHRHIQRVRTAYVHQLLAAARCRDARPLERSPQPLIEPLSERELEVLRLLAAGLEKSRDRARADHRREYGAHPYQEHLRQTGRAWPRPGDRAGARTWLGTAIAVDGTCRRLDAHLAASGGCARAMRNADPRVSERPSPQSPTSIPHLRMLAHPPCS